MKSKTYCLVSGVVFTLIACLQFLRLVLRWEVRAEGFLIPLWPSALAFLAAAFMAFSGLRLYKKQ